MSYGAQVKVGLARQATVGSWATAAGSYHPFALLTDDVGAEFSEVISENLIGRFEQGASYPGPRNVAGTLAFELTPRNLGVALMASINHAPSAVTSGSVKAHTFLPTTVDYDATLIKAPISYYKQFTDAQSAELFYDAQISQLQFQLRQGALTRGSITVTGGQRLSTGIGSLNVVPAASDVNVLYPWNVASISVGGSGVSNYSDLTITVNDPMESLYAINNSLQPMKYSRSGFREVTINGTLYFTDRALLNDADSGTQRRFLVTLINTRTAIQSGYYNMLELDIPQVLITDLKPAVSGPGEVSVSFTGRGTLDANSNYAFKAILTNTFTAY